MSVDADVSYGAGDVTVRLERNVFTLDNVFPGQAEVDDVDRAIFVQAATTDEKVIRLHVAIDELTRVDQRKPVQLNNARRH